MNATEKMRRNREYGQQHPGICCALGGCDGCPTVRQDPERLYDCMNPCPCIVPKNSRDAEGRYCGMVDETGRMAPAPPGKVGYCGPNCEHCKGFPVYRLNEDGVWACAADADYLDRED